jgi:hypothetical protein
MAYVVNRYSAEDLLNAAGDILSSATGWALHTQTVADRDVTTVVATPHWKSTPLRQAALFRRLPIVTPSHDKLTPPLRTSSMSPSIY